MQPPRKAPVPRPTAAASPCRSPATGSILDEYDTKHEIHGQLCEKCQELMREILHAEKIRVHSVSGRVKEKRKLEEKLRIPGKEYQLLSQVTDVVGLRIITYFDDDVDAVAEIVKREFDLDVPNCIDKRKSLEPDQFGYLSLHYVCKFAPTRLHLPEYRSFENLAFELQVRSLLQHTWAEIEHDLGYKSGVEVPSLIRRRFSLVAGLLEIADREFRGIRDTLSQYEMKISRQMIDPEAEIELDRVSFAAFVRQSETVKELDLHLAKLFGGSRIGEPVDEDGVTVKMLAAAGVRTVAQLRSKLEPLKERLIEYGEITCQSHCELDEIEGGLCLFHLAQILVALKGGENGLASAFEQFGIGPPGEEFASAQHVMRVMEASGIAKPKLTKRATDSQRNAARRIEKRSPDRKPSS